MECEAARRVCEYQMKHLEARHPIKIWTKKKGKK